MRRTAPVLLAAATTLLSAHSALAAAVTTRSGITVVLDEATGNYAIQYKSPDWTFGGSVQRPVNNVSISRHDDPTGTYQEIEARLTNTPITLAIFAYDDSPSVLFSWSTLQPLANPTIAFPSFTNLPPNIHPLSFGKGPFAAPEFKLQSNGTPYVLFDDSANTAILSPANQFMISHMTGHLPTQGSSLTPQDSVLTSGLNPDLKNLPEKFSHQTLLTVSPGIHNTFLAWGNALTRHLHAVRPTNDADTVLKYLGYWTDNGAYYYYNYDLSKGYTATLEELAKHYRDQNIPLRYLQLDSWWYQKTFTYWNGKPGKTKNPKLPEGTWNRYGGTLEYKASPDLFPDGLAAFQKAVNLPLVVHARWIDPESPYHKEYKISGIAPVDPKFWNDIAAYLKQSGVICYEQDWLNYIYDGSPDLQNTVDEGNAFADNMAKACASHDLTIQYCMPPARFFLQAAKYPNLTTIRVNDDRFERKKWQPFFYNSLLAEAIGKWPWTDVYYSTETDNLLLSVLSAGAVGTGDEIGKESKTNIMKAVRPDGVIVKPDAPIVATDATFIADANNQHQPLLATTYTNHDGLKTIYAFAYMRKDDANSLSVTPESLGATTPVYFYEPAKNTAKLVQSKDPITLTLDPASSDFFELIPVAKTGIALAGDADKFVGTGKQRVPAITDSDNALVATVLATPQDSEITLHGFAAKLPHVTADRATVDAPTFDSTTHEFTVKLHPDTAAPLDNFSADPVRRITVQFTP